MFFLFSITAVFLMEIVSYNLVGCFLFSIAAVFLWKSLVKVQSRRLCGYKPTNQQENQVVRSYIPIEKLA